MTRFLPLIILLAIGPLAAGNERAEKSPYVEHLRLLTIPPSELPAGCTLITGTKTASIIGAEGNPSVSHHLDFIHRLAFLGFALGDGKEKKPAGIEAAIVVMYQDQKPANEIGVYAMVCKDADEATRLAKEVPQPLRAEFARKDALLIRVWKDEGASKESHRAVRDYFGKQGFK